MRSAFNPASLPQRVVCPQLWVALVILALAWSIFSTAPAQAQSLSQGVAAFNRQDYVPAARILTPLAERGATA